MNAELVKQAMEKVGNAYVLVNLVSRRVRQLNYGGGGTARPLVANTENMAAADIALREIVEGSMAWEMPEWVQVTRPVAKKRKKAEAERPRPRAILGHLSAVATD